MTAFGESGHASGGYLAVRWHDGWCHLASGVALAFFMSNRFTEKHLGEIGAALTT